ncbi:endonuclease domain-containing protein [Sphingomonas sp.]|uniref:endonuclease domain-containing protein n=1 Tax=Sphingomonas sp. TaxID=28214 RepID=UPI003F719393
MGRTRFSSDDGSVARARTLRRERTPAEAALWAVLRNRGLDGYKFRFQQRLGPYFGDFVCQGARLVVEVDGDTHYSQAGSAGDTRRDAYLAQEGYQVVRFTNHEVMTNLDGVAHAIRSALTLTLPPPAAAGPSLSPNGARGL